MNVPILFDHENAELLISVSRLALQALDRMTGAMPPNEPMPAEELAALMRLLSAALNYGLAEQHNSNEALRTG